MDVGEARTLFEYTRWANCRALDAASRLSAGQLAHPIGGSFGTLLATLRHMLGAEWVWLERFHGRSPASFPDEAALGDVAAVSGRWAEIADGFDRFLAGLDDGALKRSVAYTSFAGHSFAQPLENLLRHVVNHSTYHRGQVTLVVRLLGGSAISSDLAAFYRERA